MSVYCEFPGIIPDVLPAAPGYGKVRTAPVAEYQSV